MVRTGSGANQTGYWSSWPSPVNPALRSLSGSTVRPAVSRGDRRLRDRRCPERGRRFHYSCKRGSHTTRLSAKIKSWETTDAIAVTRVSALTVPWVVIPSSVWNIQKGCCLLVGRAAPRSRWPGRAPPWGHRERRRQNRRRQGQQHGRQHRPEPRTSDDIGHCPAPLLAFSLCTAVCRRTPPTIHTAPTPPPRWDCGCGFGGRPGTRRR
jgi:hypothetical protein